MTDVLKPASVKAPMTDSANAANEKSGNDKPAEQKAGDTPVVASSSQAEKAPQRIESPTPSPATSRRSSSSRAENRQRIHKQRPKRRWWVLLIPILIGVLWFLQFTFFPLSPAPICPDCSPFSSLRPHLEKISAKWESPPVTVEELAEELALVEAAVQSTGLSSFTAGAGGDADCVLVLVGKFDLRYYDYVQGVISGLVGFGRNDACPQLQELESFTTKVESLLSKTSKETPRCKELLDWHVQQYSCSARQR